MAELAFLKNAGPKGILRGVYGKIIARETDNPDSPKVVFEIAPELQRIYVFALSPQMEVSPHDVETISGEESAINAAKATLLHHASSDWGKIYDRQAQFAGALASALRAESQMVQRVCQDIIRDLGFEAPRSVAVELTSRVEVTQTWLDEAIDEDGGLCLQAGDPVLLDAATSLTPIEDFEQTSFEIYPSSIDIDEAGFYDVTTRTHAKLYAQGDEDAKWLCNKVLLPLMQAGTCVTQGERAVVVGYERVADVDAYEEPDAPRG